MEKKDYTEPEVTDYGTVADLTQTGQTRAGGDGKVGSIGSPGQ